MISRPQPNAEENDVPLQAVRALAQASRRTRKAGLKQVLVRDGELVELSPKGDVLRTLKPLKLRKRVSRRIMILPK